MQLQLWFLRMQRGAAAASPRHDLVTVNVRRKQTMQRETMKYTIAYTDRLTASAKLHIQYK